jgi:hypothetical protein
MGQQEGEHQRDGVLASAHARSLGLLREVRGCAAALCEVTEHRQPDPAMQARLATSVRHA